MGTEPMALGSKASTYLLCPESSLWRVLGRGCLWGRVALSALEAGRFLGPSASPPHVFPLPSTLLTALAGPTYQASNLQLGLRDKSTWGRA